MRACVRACVCVCECVRACECLSLCMSVFLSVCLCSFVLYFAISLCYTGPQISGTIRSSTFNATQSTKKRAEIVQKRSVKSRRECVLACMQQTHCWAVNFSPLLTSTSDLTVNCCRVWVSACNRPLAGTTMKLSVSPCDREVLRAERPSAANVVGFGIFYLFFSLAAWGVSCRAPLDVN